ncbi:MAG: M24 family metallopeptidase [archaeon]
MNEIRDYLGQIRADAFLAYVSRETHGTITQDILGVPPDAMTSREHFAFIYTDKKKVDFFASKIDEAHVSDLKHDITFYYSYRNKYKLLEDKLKDLNTILLDYSFQHPEEVKTLKMDPSRYIKKGPVIPALEFVDLLKKRDAQIVNQLVPKIAFISDTGYLSHTYAAEKLTGIVLDAFELIRKEAGKIREGDVCKFIYDEIRKKGMAMENLPYEKGEQIPNSSPIVSVNENASNVHYKAKFGKGAKIKEGDLVLIDLWARTRSHSPVFADITWMGYVGEEVPKKLEDIFQTVIQARDAAVSRLMENYPGKITGQELDRVALDVLGGAGYKEEAIISRLGHAMDIQDHGKGVNLDDFEIPDARELKPRLLFTIEPGLYLPKYGFRSEIDIFLHHNRAEITTMPYQTKVIPLLAPRSSWSSCWKE